MPAVLPRVPQRNRTVGIHLSTDMGTDTQEEIDSKESPHTTGEAAFCKPGAQERRWGGSVPVQRTDNQQSRGGRVPAESEIPRTRNAHVQGQQTMDVPSPTLGMNGSTVLVNQTEHAEGFSGFDFQKMRGDGDAT